MVNTQLLVTGGPGAGATTTGSMLSKSLQIPWFDSDHYFHKLTDPPFQEQYSAQERSRLLHRDLAGSDSWILSGSISAWGIFDIHFSHAVVLNIGVQIRMERLLLRERERFGKRIDQGGDMFDEHSGFMRWASGYETGEFDGRSLPVERAFLKTHCANVTLVNSALPLDELLHLIEQFITDA